MPANSPFRVNQIDVKSLQDQWRALTGAHCGDQDAIDAAFDSLVELYSGEGRFYHNLSHVKSLLDLAGMPGTSLVSPDSVRFAIWFHDAIYDTRKTDNEERSAELARDSLRSLGIPEEVVDDVRVMILATKQHGWKDGPPDVPFFLDLDLSILGAPEDVYDDYAAAIRKEYAWVPDFVYNRGRSNILKGFLEREAIYATEEAKTMFESRARVNLERELLRL